MGFSFVHLFPTHSPSPSLLNRNVETVLGEGEKESFIALPGKGGHSKANALKTVSPLGEIRRQFYSLGSGK